MAAVAAVGLLGLVQAQTHYDSHGDTTPTSTRLRYGVSFRGEIGSHEDIDMFRLDLQGRAELLVFTTRDVDTVGTLYDSEGNMLAEDDDGGGGLNFSISQMLDGGVYYVSVRSDMGVGDYKITARIVRAGDDHGDTAGASTVLPLDVRSVGNYWFGERITGKILPLKTPTRSAWISAGPCICASPPAARPIPPASCATATTSWWRVPPRAALAATSA